MRRSDLVQLALWVATIVRLLVHILLDVPINGFIPVTVPDPLSREDARQPAKAKSYKTPQMVEPVREVIGESAVHQDDYDECCTN